MNDFIQSLSFHDRSAPVTASRNTGEVLHWVMRSFDDGPPFTAFRPMPAVTRRRRTAKSSGRSTRKS